MAERRDTLDTLSKAIGISKNGLYLKINGKNQFKVNELERIAEHYQVNINYFFDK